MTFSNSIRRLPISTERIKKAYPYPKNIKCVNITKRSIRTDQRKVQTTYQITTYYLWSYDNKLMAEYDTNGVCTREYIYLGSRLIAEYHPQTDKFYYPMQDQINTTRIITDDTGNVVYSAAHGPCGDIQKTWVNTYEPKLKFSGKERESYTEYDYFGARYYDHFSYRFLSPDPERNKDEALTNPQLWNLYSYCRNNPVTYLDPDGSLSARIEFIEHQVEKYNQIPNNPKYKSGVTRPEITKLSGTSVEVNGKYKPKFEFNMEVNIWFHEDAKAHEWRHARDMLKAFKSPLNYLRLVEKMSFKNKSTCDSWIESTINDVGRLMQAAAKASVIRRDIIPFPADGIDSFFDLVFGRGVKGKGIKRVQEWKE